MRNYQKIWLVIIIVSGFVWMIEKEWTVPVKLVDIHPQITTAKHQPGVAEGLPEIKGTIEKIAFRKPLTERQKYAIFLRNHPFNQYAKKEEEEKKGESENEADNPEEALKQDFLRTMDPQLKRPTPEVLSDIVKKNVETAMIRKRTDGIPGTTANAWVERGPSNIGGRTRALVWDPNDASKKKVWAGGTTGGLWYNNDITDANSSWKKVDDFWNNISVTAIAFDPVNPLIAYVGTGEGFFSSNTYGAGIWKTTDGGTTWNQLSSTANFNFINDMAVRAEGGKGVIYAAVDGYGDFGYAGNFASAGLQQSTDGGITWTQVLPKISGNKLNFIPASISIGPDNRIWVGTKVNAAFGERDLGAGRILFSDNGANWTVSYSYPLTNIAQGRVTVAAAPSNSKYAYAFIENSETLGGLFKTTNGGSSWSLLAYPDDIDSRSPARDFTRGQAWYDQVLEVDPNDENTVIAGGVDLFRSTNGGTSWSQISRWISALSGPASVVHADQHTAAFKPGSSSTIIFGNDGGVFYSSSISTAATNDVILSRNKGYNVTQFYSAAMHPAAGSNIFLAGAQDNGSQRFTTAGLNNTVDVSGGDGAYCFIDQQNPSYQITSYIHNVYYLSKDGGANFDIVLLDDDDKESGFFINTACYDNNQHILYTYKSPGVLYRVKNVTTTPSSGMIYLPGVTDPITAFRVSPYTTTSTTLFLGTATGDIIKVTNANTTPYVSFVTGQLPTGSISCIEMGADENELLVTFSNYGIKKIWFTQDGGANWVDKMGNFPNIPVRWAMFNPNLRSNEVILATQLGIYGTTNFNNPSPSWTQVNNGFANVRTDMLQIRSSDNLVAAATYGRGLFTSNGFTPIGTVNPPTITSFSPTSATTGATITLTGLDFSNATSIRLGGTPATSFSVLSSTAATAVVGGGTSGNVEITTSAGTGSKSGFTYVIGPPTVSSFKPGSAGQGALVTITGINLNAAISPTAVSFGGTTAAAFTVTSSTEIVAMVGAGATGTVSVTTTSGTSAKAGFTFLPPPTLTTFLPTTAAAGATITMTGTNFNNVLDVSFGGTSVAAFTVTSASSITALLGQGSIGDASVTTQGGTAAKSGFIYVNGGPPQISSVSPGTAQIGGMITITGSNFNPLASGNLIFFGAVKTNAISVTTGSISVKIPTGVTYQPITVLDKSTGLAAYSSKPLGITFRSRNAIATKDFDPKVDFATNAGPAAFALGDIDGDGKVDIVVSNGNNIISIYRNKSSAGSITTSSFDSKVDFTTGTRPGSVAIADLDGDGKLDIAVVNTFDKSVSIFRNTAVPGIINSSSLVSGYGLAASTSSQSLLSGPVFIAISDLDGDGKPDIVIANQSANSISIFRNSAIPGNFTKSSFSSKVDFATGAGPTSIAIGDIDGDGKPDIAVTNGGSTDKTISILRNTSSVGSINNSSFATKVDFQTNSVLPQSIVIADLDGDGKKDIAVTLNFGTNGNLNIFRNIGSPGSISSATFATRFDLGIGRSTSTSAIAINDMDGDGKPDIITSSSVSGIITVLKSTVGSGVLSSTDFSSRTDLLTGSIPSATSVGDIDGDGLPDMLVINSNTASFSVFRNSPALPPLVSSFTPTKGGVGSVITITGTDLTDATSVSIGGTAAASFKVLSSTTIVAVVGTGSSGSISVTTIDGSDGLPGFVFFPPPVISSFSPTSAANGGVITITGTNLSGTLTVSFGGTAANAFTVTSATEIKASVGSGNSGTISLTTPGGTATITGFIFCPAPIITAGGPLTFCSGNSLVLTSNAFSGSVTPTYQWYKDGTAIANATALSTTVTGSGVYKVGVNSANNCFALSAGSTVVVNPLPAKPTISRNNADLVSSSAAGNQWYNDANILSSATAQNYRPINSGYFKVQVTDVGCVGPYSDPYYYLVTAVTNISGNSIGTYKMVPNPTRERLFIQADNTNNRITVQMIDPNGRVMLKQEFTGSTSIDMTAFSKGMYTILLTDSRTKKQESKQIIKQ